MQCDYLKFDIPFFDFPAELKFWVLQSSFIFKAFGMFNTGCLFNVDSNSKIFLQQKDTFQWKPALLTLSNIVILKSNFKIPGSNTRYSINYDITISNGLLKDCYLRNFELELDSNLINDNFLLINI